jgi:hypothetical protein
MPIADPLEDRVVAILRRRRLIAHRRPRGGTWHAVAGIALFAAGLVIGQATGHPSPDDPPGIPPVAAPPVALHRILELQEAGTTYAAALARFRVQSHLPERRVGQAVARASFDGLGVELHRLDPSGQTLLSVLEAWRATHVVSPEKEG